MPNVARGRRGPGRHLAVELVLALAGIAAMTATGHALSSRWPAPATAVVVTGLIVAVGRQCAVTPTLPPESVVMEPGTAFLVPACVLLPPVAAPLLSLFVDAWFYYQAPATRGRRRVDMALQMAPAYAVAAATAHVLSSAGADRAAVAVVAAGTYLVVNSSAVLLFGTVVMRRSVRSLVGDGAIWRVDACVAAFGALAATATETGVWSLLLAIPVSLLCQGALTRPHLEAELTRDPKTDLLNCRGMAAAGRAFVKVARRQRAPAGVLMIDIDNFKAINDEHGHPVGDEVLREVGARLGAVVPPGGAAGRVGGEEFLLLLPGHDLNMAMAVADRALAAIAAAGIATEQGLLNVTVSIGCAATQGADEGDGNLLETLTGQADVELYAAKAGGKNRVSPRPGPVDLPRQDRSRVDPRVQTQALTAGERPTAELPT